MGGLALWRGREGWLPLMDSAVAAGLAVLLLISGIYAIPYTLISADWIVYAKRVYYLILMVLLAILAVVGRPSPIDRRFSLSCGFLALVVSANGLIRQDMPEEYLYNVLSIAFIWLFVRHVADARFPMERFMGHLRVGLVVINLLAMVVLVNCLMGDREMHTLVASGFDGNRVNFSIWLGQIVFLNFLLAGRLRSGFLLALVASSVLLTIQVFSGGRIGLLVTLSIVAFFTVRRLDKVVARIAVLSYLVALVWVAGHYSPVTKVGEDISIFRELDFVQAAPLPTQGSPSELKWIDEVVEYVDGVSAHRLVILFYAVEAMDMEALLIGKGIGHFDVVADNATWMVHNVFLKMLGELGVGAFFPLMALVWLPFSHKYRERYDGLGLHFMLLVGIGVALLQPRFIVTGLSNCLVLWLCYALILKQTKPGGEAEPGWLVASSRAVAVRQALS